MEPDGRDDGRDARPRLDIDSLALTRQDGDSDSDLVFDFSGLQRPDLADLSLILTARLSAKPGDRVWMRALPLGTWRILSALGLDHLFRIYPGPADEPN
jgi:hypothetical protein